MPGPALALGLPVSLDCCLQQCQIASDTVQWYSDHKVMGDGTDSFIGTVVSVSVPTLACSRAKDGLYLFFLVHTRKG